jgi:hypothetical protein
MLCDKYKGALIEAAASGAALPSQVGAHVSICVHCGEMFAAEQSVFALVDSGLRSRANAIIPRNFDYRVRAALQVEAAQGRKRYPAVLAWCSLAAAATLMALLMTPNLKQDTKRTTENALVKRKLLISPASPVHSGNAASLGPSTVRKPYSRARVLKVLQQAKASVHGPDEPEVLVPQGQEELLAKYMEGITARKARVIFSADLQHETNMKPVEVPSIEISELAVKPLSDLSSK